MIYEVPTEELSRYANKMIDVLVHGDGETKLNSLLHGVILLMLVEIDRRNQLVISEQQKQF
jgi:hypothetical protein